MERTSQYVANSPPNPPTTRSDSGVMGVRSRRKSAAADIHSNQILTRSFMNDGEEDDLVREAAK